MVYISSKRIHQKLLLHILIWRQEWDLPLMLQGFLSGAILLLSVWLRHIWLLFYLCAIGTLSSITCILVDLCPHIWKTLLNLLFHLKSKKVANNILTYGLYGGIIWNCQSLHCSGSPVLKGNWRGLKIKPYLLVKMNY